MKEPSKFNNGFLSVPVAPYDDGVVEQQDPRTGDGN